MQKILLKKSEDLKALTDEIFDKEKSKILNLCQNIEVEHVGGTSIPGALTVGDLDIQIKVGKDDFEKIVEKLKDLYRVNHSDKWTDQFAIFHKKDNQPIPLSVMVTVIDSKFDEFSKMRDKLINEPNFLDKYNKLKMKFVGKDKEGYKKAKRDFFGPNGNSRILYD